MSMFLPRSCQRLLPGLVFLLTACGGGGGGGFLPLAAPTGLQYPVNPATYTLGQAIPANTPTVGGGPVGSYAVAPALPGGLVLATATGALSGTPTVLAPTATYTVTASNAAGGTTTLLSLAVKAPAPSGLSYTTSAAVYVVGQTIVSNVPTATGGAIISYDVAPALPLGLALDSATGVISGSPSRQTATSTYTVTATNSGGLATVALSITVNDQAPTALGYSVNPVSYVPGRAIPANAPIVYGGAPTTYQVSPPLPPGLLLDPASGVITGTPTTPTPRAKYRVTASNPTGSVAALLAVVVPPQPRYAFTANRSNDTLTSYAVDAATGQLWAQGSLPAGSIPQDLEIAPGGRFAYAVNYGASTVSGYALNPVTGALTPLPSGPFPTGTSPVTLAFDPAGRFVFVANLGSANGLISAFTLDAATGSLAPVAGSPFATGVASPTAIVVDPSGKFAYVGHAGSGVAGFLVGASGALTPLSGSPFPAGNGPSALAVDPSGQFLLVPNRLSDTVTVFGIDPSLGTLIPSSGSPYPTGSVPSSVAIDPAGRFAFIACSGSKAISVFAIHPASGGLTPLASGPISTGSRVPGAIRVDPSGSFAYVTYPNVDEIQAFSLAFANGALTPGPLTRGGRGLSGLAFNSGSAPLALKPKALYVASTNGGNTTGALSGFTVDAVSGALAALPGTPVPSGWNTQGVSVDPLGARAYIANYSSSLTGFALGADGAPSALPGSPFAAPTSHSAWGSAVDPSGRFVYYANYNNGGAGSVSGFTIDPASGSLTAMAGSPFPAGNGPTALTVDPTGRFVYVVNSFGASLSAYAVQPTTGVLFRLDGDTGTAGAQDFATGDSYPSSVAVAPNGRFVYVGHDGSGIAVFSIETTTGILTRIDADPGTAGVQNVASSRPYAVAIEPSGRFAYVVQSGGFNRVAVYALDPESGGMTGTGNLVATASVPRVVTVEASGRFVFVANYGSNSVSVFRLDPASGSLSPVTGSPFAVSGASSPTGLATTATLQ
jgi:6-phosphogluconolactonase (cycloisomerase 2 family)